MMGTLIRTTFMLIPALLLAGAALAQDAADSHAGHDSHAGMDHGRFDARGIVMNANSTELPRDCAEINQAHEFTVHVGRTYAADYPGTSFGMSLHEYQVAPCSLVTITLVNEDEIRHQWMLHGLPLYLYPQGMFHLEAAGGETVTGSFIVPSDNQTYLVHCDMAQHMEKGMKGQLVAGSGSGNLWSVPGVSGYFRVSAPGLGLGVPLVITMAIMSFLVMAYLGRQDQP